MGESGEAAGIHAALAALRVGNVKQGRWADNREKSSESNEWIAESSRNQLLSLSFIMRKYYCNGRDGADAKLEWLVAHESRNGKKKNFID